MTGAITFRGSGQWVLDFGIPAVCDNTWSEPPARRPFAVGEVGLEALTAGIWEDDLFVPPAPPIDLVWEVERIWLETTPWIEIAPRSYERADVGPSFVEVDKTGHAFDDRGRADYLLDCRLMGGPSRAGP